MPGGNLYFFIGLAAAVLLAGLLLLGRRRWASCAAAAGKQGRGGVLARLDKQSKGKGGSKQTFAVKNPMRTKR